MEEELRRKEAVVEGRTVVAGTPGELVPDWWEALDPSRKREVRFVEKKEVVEEKS